MGDISSLTNLLGSFEPREFLLSLSIYVFKKKGPTPSQVTDENTNNDNNDGEKNE